jgi:cell division septation protein DedD
VKAAAETPVPSEKPVEVASLQLPAAAPPKPEKPAPAAAPPSGAWRVQLGAFSQKGNAEGLYKKLAGSGALAGRKPFYVAAGAVTKLQVGPFESRAAAQAVCNRLEGPCIPVSGK